MLGPITCYGLLGRAARGAALLPMGFPTRREQSGKHDHAQQNQYVMANPSGCYPLLTKQRVRGTGLSRAVRGPAAGVMGGANRMS
jgi:hypothetical protein